MPCEEQGEDLREHWMTLLWWFYLSVATVLSFVEMKPLAITHPSVPQELINGGLKNSEFTPRSKLAPRHLHDFHSELLSNLCPESDDEYALMAEEDPLARVIWGCYTATSTPDKLECTVRYPSNRDLSSRFGGSFCPSSTGREASPVAFETRSFLPPLPRVPASLSLPSLDPESLVHGVESHQSSSSLFSQSKRDGDVSVSVEDPWVNTKVGSRMTIRNKKPKGKNREPSFPPKVRFRSEDGIQEIPARESQVIPSPGVKPKHVEIARLRSELIMDKLAKSPRTIFDSQLQYWLLFCSFARRILKQVAVALTSQGRRCSKP